MRSTPERANATRRIARGPAVSLWFAASALLAAAPIALASTFRVVTPSEANYRVREQLAGITLPGDVVGTTSAISGLVSFAEFGALVPGGRVEVELAGLTSDNAQRDRDVRRNLLQTESFPAAVFVSTAISGLPAPLPSEGTYEVEIEGHLTLRDITRPVTWRGTATFDGNAARLEAVTTFRFEDFELPRPRVALVITVVDEINLEVRLTLARTED